MYLHVIEYPNYPKGIPGIKFTKISGYQKLYKNNLLHCILEIVFRKQKKYHQQQQKITQNNTGKISISQGLYGGNTKAVLKVILKN